MNTNLKFRSLVTVINLFLIVSASLLFCSCYTSLFSNPQPIDAKNIYEFPKQFRGTWVVDEGDTITIGTDYFRWSEGNETKIINGIYINPADTMTFQKNDTTTQSKRMKASKPFECLQSIHYDSVNNPIDTVTNYIIKRNKIYKVKSDRLEEGTLFDLKNDTIYTRERNIFLHELGRNNFLRHVSENKYIININLSSPLNYDYQGWWMLLLIEKKPDGTINIGLINHEKVNDSEKIYSVNSDWYFDSQWTKHEVEKLISDSLFMSDVTVLEKRMKIKKSK